MGEVIKFPHSTETKDGSGPNEIVIRIVMDEPEEEPPPEKQRFSWGAFLGGVLFGWWLG